MGKERERGVTVYRVNHEALRVAVNDILKATYGDENFEEVRPWETFIAKTYADKGVWGLPKTVVLCTEGVGYVQDEMSRCTINYQIGMSSGWVDISEDYLWRLPNEPVDLADVVRSFGQRLEDNFRLWYKALKEPVTV